MDSFCSGPKWSTLRRNYWEHPDALLPDHSTAKSGCPDLHPIATGCSDSQRTIPRVLHQKKTPKKVVPFWNGRFPVWHGPMAALGCWSDVPVKTGPTGVVQGHSTVGPNVPS